MIVVIFRGYYIYNHYEESREEIENKTKKYKLPFHLVIIRRKKNYKSEYRRHDVRYYYINIL
jgi:hypothetical protein